MVIGDCHGVSQATVCGIIKHVTQLIAGLEKR